MSDRRLIAFAGIGGVVLLLAGQILVVNAPAIDRSGADIRAWSVDHRSQALTAIYLLVLGFSIQLVFWAGLWQRLRATGGDAVLLANAGLAAAVSLSAILVTGFGFAATLHFRASALSDDTARLLNDLTFVSVNLSSIATAVALAAFAGAIRRTEALPSWIAWFAFGAAAVHLVAGAAYANSGMFSPDGIGIYVAPLLYYAWIVAVSAQLLRGSEDPAGQPVAAGVAARG